MPKATISVVLTEPEIRQAVAVYADARQVTPQAGSVGLVVRNGAVVGAEIRKLGQQEVNEAIVGAAKMVVGNKIGGSTIRTHVTDAGEVVGATVEFAWQRKE